MALDPAARKKRDRKARSKRQARRNWRDMWSWRGEALTPLGGYFIVLALALGTFWGLLGSMSDPGARSPEITLVGLAVGLVVTSVLFAALPILLASIGFMAAFFVGALAFGPTWPHAISPGIMGAVAGILVGCALRWAIVGKRAPVREPSPFVPRKLPAWTRRRAAKMRTDLISSIVGLVAFLAVSGWSYFGGHGGNPVWLYLVLLAIAFLWGVPMGRHAYRAQAKQVPWGAVAQVAGWGLILGGLAAASAGLTFVFWLFSCAAGASATIIVSQLLAARTARGGAGRDGAEREASQSTP
ncbi:hypothetical protein GCM10025867_51360 (plasmid) [Frondihabitans sucicola]|uniref:Uncharacterized protein n=1 Tax=Frondihabitans sucicola TaxID=1268041 RepID=A0ABM8GV23_9MICO|nr:hypothetical protein [Frondihabitans sucicola]BDZ52328.1 hypothetical protein GCM10025867_45690 [Frondihabitans sucicola]BDZ52895.1 hypothetical protein GCM10025867_51360 [Frondihabitans sucicola]